MTEVAYEGTRLAIGEHTITLPDPVNGVIEMDDCIIVLMDTLGTSGVTRNVWAFDWDGNRLWVIEPADEYNGSVHPYTSISIRDGDLHAHNWNGISHTIDNQTGTIVGKEFVG